MKTKANVLPNLRKWLLPASSLACHSSFLILAYRSFKTILKRNYCRSIFSCGEYLRSSVPIKFGQIKWVFTSDDGTTSTVPSPSTCKSLSIGLPMMKFNNVPFGYCFISVIVPDNDLQAFQSAAHTQQVGNLRRIIDFEPVRIACGGMMHRFVDRPCVIFANAVCEHLESILRAMKAHCPNGNEKFEPCGH